MLISLVFKIVRINRMMPWAIKIRAILESILVMEANKRLTPNITSNMSAI
jgi:hypothetical protein